MSEQDQEKTTAQGGTSSKSGTKSASTASKSTAGSRSSSRGRSSSAGQGGKRAAAGQRGTLQGPAMGCARRDVANDPFQSPNWRPGVDSFGTGRQVWPD
jgi:hypothetical protein